MKYSEVREYALSLPEVVEAPHFHFASFRVSGRIFVTVPPGESHLHVFIGDEQREAALVLEPEIVEQLRWGDKVVGVRVGLAGARSGFVMHLVRQAWERKAPKRLLR